MLNISEHKLLASGKVRDIYDYDNSHLIFTATDRMSAFDRAICTIPSKGAVLTQLSAWWFTQTENIIPNHYIKLLNYNSMLVKKCKVLPIEVIVRGYLTGATKTSIWTLYNEGQREFFDVVLKDNLSKNNKLDKPILTPTTKSDNSDVPLTTDNIYQHINPKLWDKISNTVTELFTYGEKIAKQNNLILVDTKYEFGLDSNNNLILIDELHTPDSSRYWSKDKKEQYDKEILRQWYIEHSNPYQDKVLPKAPYELINLVADRYIDLYTKLTKQKINQTKN